MEKKTEIKDLLVALDKKLPDRERVGILIKLAESYWQQAEYSECKKYAETACWYARKQDYKEELAISYYLIGLADNYLNLYDEALENHQKAIQLNKKLGKDSNVAEGLNNIGQIYLNIGDLAKARSCFEESVKYNPEFSRGYNNLGVILIRQNELDLALKFMLKGLELLENSDFPDKYRSRVISHINISEIYLKLGDYQTAVKYAEKAMELSADSQDDTLIYGLMCYGSILMEQDQNPEALKYLHQALDLSMNQENREICKEINYLLSVSYEHSGNFKESLKYLKKHIELEKQIYQESLSKRLEHIQSVYEEENQQLKAQQMIEKASRIATIGAMAAAITHEINQPLCAVKVSADSILFWKKRRQISFPDDIEESLKTITEGANLINDIIQHVRSFWHPQDEPGKGHARLNETIKKALGLLERQIFSHGIFLSVQNAEPEMLVKMIPVHLEQVIINVVVNAVHALDDCNHLRKDLKIVTQRNGRIALIKIIDNASGIDPSLQEKIFDPFFTSKTDGKGMGLGLSIVDNYLRKYKGSIKVENNESGGATFIIALPLTEEAE